MSEVSSAGSFNQMARSYNELEDDLKDQTARAREADEERISELDEGYKENIRKSEAGYEETINDMRDHYSSQLDDQKRQHQAQLNDKRYDRNGRETDSEGKQLRQEIAMMQDELSARDEAYDSRVNDAEGAYGRKLSRQREEHSRELEQNVERAREAANESVEHTHATGKERQAYEKGRIQKQYATAVKELQEQLFLEQKRARHAVEDIEDTGEHKLRAQERAVDSRANRSGVATLREREREMEAIRDSHRAETDKLRSEIGVLTEKGRDFPKGRAEGRAESIKEHDDEWRLKFQTMSRAHEEVAEKSGEQTEQAEKYLNTLHGAVLRDQEREFTGQMKKQGMEHRFEQKALEGAFRSALEQKDLMATKERERFEASSRERLDKSNAQRDRALATQAETYRELAVRTSDDNHARVARLKNKISELENPKDAADIPSNAVDTIQRQTAAEHQKTLDQDLIRNKRAIEALHSGYSEREQAQTLKAQGRERDMTQRAALESSQQASVFASHIYDTEETKKAAINGQRVEFDNEIDKFRKNQARLTTEMKRRYEDIIDERERESESKFTIARQEAEFNLKLERRNNAQRMSDVVRAYEKMVTDQKEDFQTQVADAKREGEKLAEDARRQSKLEIERQAQEYEHRLAQTEATHKGRENSIAAGYEEQLENVRRANARAFREKSERA